MKTVKITTAIATFSLVFFMSLTSIANCGTTYSGDLIKSGDKSLNISGASEKDYSYLRFDAGNYINANESEAIELPLANEFEYLRFDVNKFTESIPERPTDLPVNEFNYLRFDVNNFTATVNSIIDVLPLTE
jgi:hypothetical protein